MHGCRQLYRVLHWRHHSRASCGQGKHIGHNCSIPKSYQGIYCRVKRLWEGFAQGNSSQHKIYPSRCYWCKHYRDKYSVPKYCQGTYCQRRHIYECFPENFLQTITSSAKSIGRNAICKHTPSTMTASADALGGFIAGVTTNSNAIPGSVVGLTGTNGRVTAGSAVPWRRCLPRIALLKHPPQRSGFRSTHRVLFALTAVFPGTELPFVIFPHKCTLEANNI